MNRSTPLTLLVGGLAAAAALAVMCPVAMADSSPSPAPSGSTGSMVGGSPATWSPLHATRAQSGSRISLVPDQAILFDGFADSVHFTSSNPRVFVAADAEGKGTYTAQAGGHAVKQGTATVTATRGGRQVARFSIVVK